MINPLSCEAVALKRAIKRVFVARGAFSLRALASLDLSILQGAPTAVNTNRPTQRVTHRTAHRGRWAAPGKLGVTALAVRPPLHSPLAACAA